VIRMEAVLATTRRSQQLARRATAALLGGLIGGAGLVMATGTPALASNWSHDGTELLLGTVKAHVGGTHLNDKLKSTGKGVGIALIDTGVAPVAGLTSGNVVNGPDLSFEGQDSTLRYRDTNGHGTQLAGIIAARATSKKDTFAGIAPDARLTSVKVAGTNGAVDVTQVIAAIDWAVRTATTTGPTRSG
jgi:serine protease AprX